MASYKDSKGNGEDSVSNDLASVIVHVNHCFTNLTDR
jgi:hypothetical protein